MLFPYQNLQVHFDSTVGKESTCNTGDPSSIPGSGRSAGEGKGYPLQYSGLENSMYCIVRGSQKVRHDWETFIFIYFPILYLDIWNFIPSILLLQLLLSPCCTSSPVMNHDIWILNIRLLLILKWIWFTLEEWGISILVESWKWIFEDTAMYWSLYMWLYNCEVWCKSACLTFPALTSKVTLS